LKLRQAPDSQAIPWQARPEVSSKLVSI